MRIRALSCQAITAFSAILYVAIPISADAHRERIWIVLEHGPRQVSLMYGKPESDDIIFDFTCIDKLTKLYYSFEREEKPYGTIEPVTIVIKIGRKQIVAPATATFDEGGRPRIETQDSVSPALIAGLNSRGRIRAMDRWGGSSAPAVPPARLKEWQAKCGA